MDKKGKKIILSNREVEVKVFLEVLAVFSILILVFIGIYYLEPKITGFAVISSSEVNPGMGVSDEIIKTMLFLILILIIFLLIYNLILRGKTPVEERGKKGKRANIEIKKKRKDKSRLFVKCHNLLLKTDKALQNSDIFGANMLYIKTRKTYMKLEYIEKKELYKDILRLYNRVSKDISIK